MGYLLVGLKGNRTAVHILVARTFLPNPLGKPTVDHINRNPKDNRLCNLVWATHKEQAANRSKYDVRHPTKPVVSTDESGTECFYPSIIGAAAEIGGYHQYLSKTLRAGRTTKCYGRFWRYATEEDIKKHSEG